jgi:hypothetical protein
MRHAMPLGVNSRFNFQTAKARDALRSSLRANGSRECAPDDRLREVADDGALQSIETVITGLDPVIHPLRWIRYEEDGWIAGHRRAEATPSFRRRGPAMTKSNDGKIHLRLLATDCARVVVRNPFAQQRAWGYPKRGAGNAGCPLHPQPRV